MKGDSSSRRSSSSDRMIFEHQWHILAQLACQQLFSGVELQDGCSRCSVKVVALLFGAHLGETFRAGRALLPVDPQETRRARRAERSDFRRSVGRSVVT